MPCESDDPASPRKVSTLSSESRFVEDFRAVKTAGLASFMMKIFAGRLQSAREEEIARSVVPRPGRKSNGLNAAHYPACGEHPPVSLQINPVHRISLWFQPTGNSSPR